MKNREKGNHQMKNENRLEPTQIVHQRINQIVQPRIPRTVTDTNAVLPID